MTWRNTIDFGIYLGLHNAQIAVLRGATPELIKNSCDNDSTPCAVYIDKRGQIRVGQLAKHRMEDQTSADDVYIEFKRRMGTDHKYEFRQAARVLRPEELSAEVLKSLCADVLMRTGERPSAAVITVPAAFEQKHCSATKRAGELAGLVQCPLIMEPTAAALAYGFQAEVTKEYWLVYDFGGGTFDVCLMKAEDGGINIENHGGDNFLGGSDIDWAIIDNLVVPQLMENFSLCDFSRGNKKWRTALAVVKRSVENAKIQLSRSETAYLEDCKIRDADEREIDVTCKLTRDAVISVAEPIIMRSIDICKRVLKERNLSPSAIEKVILVGGPTLAPYFREMLHENLGIALDHGVDPLTVVAKGAAVFAGTQRLTRLKAPEVINPQQFTLELTHKTAGPEHDPTIRGVVRGQHSPAFVGFALKFDNVTSGWTSGMVPLNADGRFKTSLLAAGRDTNCFLIRLFDSAGHNMAVKPHQLTYTIAPEPAGPKVVIHSIGVGIGNNPVDVILARGTCLPAKAVRVYTLNRGLQKGATGQLLRLPIVEGEQGRADRNVLLGTLEIRGTDIRRDLPAGSEIEVTLQIDSSRIIRTKAYVPKLDEEFEAVIKPNEKSADPNRLRQEVNDEVKRRDRLRAQAKAACDERCMALLAEVADLDHLELLVDAAEDDPDFADKAERQLLEVKIALDRAEGVSGERERSFRCDMDARQS